MLYPLSYGGPWVRAIASTHPEQRTGPLARPSGPEALQGSMQWQPLPTVVLAALARRGLRRQRSRSGQGAFSPKKSAMSLVASTDDVVLPSTGTWKPAPGQV